MTSLMLTKKSHPKGHPHTKESPTTPREKVKDRNEPHRIATNCIMPRVKDYNSSFVRAYAGSFYYTDY
jgi:hypothetical protein